jgi:hypothetical protein
MTYFLEAIAQSLYKEFGNKLNGHCLVFPNRRAGLYFLKYLATRINKPVWAPSILTINELFKENSSLQTAGNEVLLFELYKVYRKIKKSPESFDDFYFWGDMLLNDFDDIDKYLVNASLLFRNVLDLKNIDQQFGGLTNEQIEIVKRFWINFNPEKNTREKSGFISIWSVLDQLYSGFRKSLEVKNLAYEGMIFRELAEKQNVGVLLGDYWEKVHFIGFNALNECEKSIMLSLRKAGKARFYWDYDNSYISETRLNSAGLFLMKNLKIFGNDMPSDWSYDTFLTSGEPSVKHVVIDASSDVAQVKLISKLIENLPDVTPGNAHHTAVILADENLLMPVLTSLPENIGDINITMGHPLKQTQIYTFIRHLMDLQRTAISIEGIVRFSYREVINILKHTMMSGLMSNEDIKIIKAINSTNFIWLPSEFFSGSANLTVIFQKPETPALLSGYFKEILSMIAQNEEQSTDTNDNKQVQHNIRNEFIYRVVLSINRLEVIVKNPEISFTTDTYIKIFDRMLRLQSVPFSGEPLSGIQIMGILETRALDFKNLIILSVNEGVLPAVSSGSSFIPFSLREAFGLPSINHQESIYAYHFYRLLQRAENVTFTYNSNSEGLKSGEMSRFLIQMKYEKALKPAFMDLNFEIRTQISIKNSLERTAVHSELLTNQFLTGSKGRLLSPSAINTWLNCRMKFYYRYVNGLKEPDRIATDIDPAMLGNILHEVLRSLYEKFRGSIVNRNSIDSLINDKKLLAHSINEAISEKFSNGNLSPVGGNELIVRDVLMVYLIKILNIDRSVAPFTILNLEDSFSFLIPAFSGDAQIEVRTGGKADRIDEVNNVRRIVDYKTGTVADTINSIRDLFNDDRKKDTDGWLQTLLYCEAYLANNPESIVRPSIYKVKKTGGIQSEDKLRIKLENKSELILEDYAVVRDEFMDNLKEIVRIIFSRDEPFTMTDDIRGKCSYCPYKALCLR